MADIDEFTIPRPRWIIPMAIVGVVLLTIVLLASFGTGDDEKPVIQRSGTTLVIGDHAGSTTTPGR